MFRLATIRSYVDNIIDKISNPELKQIAVVHLYGVSALGAQIALKRGLNGELAAIAGLLHDIYKFHRDNAKFHSHNSAEMARVALKRMACFTEEETRIILAAIYHHSDKAHVHDPYDEVLKDADVLHWFLYDGGQRIDYSEQLRTKRIAIELGLPLPQELYGDRSAPSAAIIVDKRLRLADVAETLASRHIVGERQDADYMEIIKYWPEEEAFDELKNGWCATFVYHCCQEAGFTLPIRLPNSPCRLAGVAAWNVWAREPERNFFLQDEPGLLPERGDIVLYRNIIPSENKPEEQRSNPIDHIGIVLSCDGESFIVAEGNVNNQNRSGIVTRTLHQNIEGFIRIDNAFEYDGWKIDYKTGKERVVLFAGV